MASRKKSDDQLVDDFRLANDRFGQLRSDVLAGLRKLFYGIAVLFVGGGSGHK